MPGSVCEYQGRCVQVIRCYNHPDCPHGEWQEVEAGNGDIIRVHNGDMEPVFDEEFRDIGIYWINERLKGAFDMDIHPELFRYLSLYEENT